MTPGRPRLGASLLAAATLLLLTGCISQPTFPSPPPSTTPAATAEPTDAPTPTPTASPDPAPAASPERILVDAEYLTVVADDGTELARFDYFQPTGEVIAGLSSYLGAPADTWSEGGGHAPPTTFHDWGGLRLADTVPAGSRPYDPEHWVRITSTDANGLAVLAADGVGVGDAVAPLIESAGSDEVYRWTSPETGAASVSFRIDLVELPAMPGADPSDDWAPSFGVMVVGDDTAGTITSIAAPSANFGA